jgi:hypothetical protein
MRSTASPRATEELDELLDEVRGLRLTFVTDLSTAASAVELGATDVASDIIGADRAELDRFFRAADDRLRELERAAYRTPEQLEPELADVVPIGSRSDRSSTRRRLAMTLPAIPLVGALTMAAAAAAGILPVPGTSTARPHTANGVTVTAATESNALRQFEQVVNSDPSAQQVIAAADKLHQQIVALMATSHGDPAQANAIAQLLQMERALLLSKRPPGAQTVLAATGSLITQLTNHAKTVVSPVMVSPKPMPVPTTSSTSKPSPSPSPTKTSPKPTHSSSPSPTPSSSSSSPTGPLPKVGG